MQVLIPQAGLSRISLLQFGLGPAARQVDKFRWLPETGTGLSCRSYAFRGYLPANISSVSFDLRCIVELKSRGIMRWRFTWKQQYAITTTDLVRGGKIP